MTWEPTPTPAPATPAPGTPATPAAPAVAPVRRRSGRWVDLALAGAAVLAIAGVAFAVGRTTAPAAAAPAFQRGGFAPDGAFGPTGSFDPGAGPNGGGPGGRFFGGGGLTMAGTVTAIDADSITLTLEDGSERTFELDSSTTYHASTDASASDVAVGDDVAVQVDAGAGFGGQDPNGGNAGGDPQLSASDVTVTR